MKIYQYKEKDLVELISAFIKRKFLEKPYIEAVTDGRRISVKTECIMYTDGIMEKSETYGTTTINGFSVIILLYHGDIYRDMESRLKIFYNKDSSMSYGNFKKLISDYIDTYVETYM